MWQMKPPAGAMILRGHPLAQGLVHCHLLQHGGLRAPDIARSGIGKANSALWRQDQWGKSWNPANLANQIELPPIVADTLNQSFTVVVGVILTSTATGEIFGNRGSTNARLLNYGTFTATRVTTVDENVAVINATGALLNVAERPYHIAWVYDKGRTTSNLYLDGLLVETDSYTFTGNFTGTYYIGDNSNVAINGRIGYLYIYNRALSPTHVRDLAVNPYAFFTPADDFGTLKPAAGGGVVGTVFRSPVIRGYPTNL